MTPKISVIVPVYNSEKYLDRCINSILNQSFVEFELILVDDGSTDNSGTLCDNYASKDGRVIVLHQSNQGQASARNNAISKSCGEWLHFVDSDDAIHPDMLSYLYSAVIQEDAGMSVCGYTEAESVPNEFWQDHPFDCYALKCKESVLREWLRDGKYYWIVWAKLIRKSIIEKYMFTEGKYYEDNAIVCKWICEANKIAIVPLPLYFYQVNYAGTTKGKLDYKYFDFLWAMEQQIDYYDSIGYFDILEDVLLYYFASFEDRYQKTSLVKNGLLWRYKIKKNALRIWLKYKKKYNTVNTRWKDYFLLVHPKISLLIHGIKSGNEGER